MMYHTCEIGKKWKAISTISKVLLNNNAFCYPLNHQGSNVNLYFTFIYQGNRNSPISITALFLSYWSTKELTAKLWKYYMSHVKKFNPIDLY